MIAHFGLPDSWSIHILVDSEYCINPPPGYGGAPILSPRISGSFGPTIMTIDKSLKIQAGSAKQRNVLTRPERLAKLIETERWQEGDAILGLPKVRVQKISMKKKKKAKKEDEAEAPPPPLRPARNSREFARGSTRHVFRLPVAWWETRISPRYPTHWARGPPSSIRRCTMWPTPARSKNGSRAVFPVSAKWILRRARWIGPGNAF